MVKEVKKKNIIVVCYLCGKPTNEDGYCYGCEQYICAKCENEAEMPLGPHTPADHCLAKNEEEW